MTSIDKHALSDHVTELLARHGVPGCAVAVLRDAQLAWADGFGVTRSGNHAPVTPSTVFVAASLTKPLFALATVLLANEGRLDLDEPLAEYLPVCYAPGVPSIERITARHVLTHSTGLQNWRWQPGEQLEVRFAPGTEFGYSSEGYVYLQRVIKHLMGRHELERLLRHDVLDALDMRASSFVWRDDYSLTAATGHNELGEPVPSEPTKSLLACSSLYTTSGDYARFVAATLRAGREGGGTPVGDALTKMLNPTTRAGASVWWGLGWGLQRTDAGLGFWHWGDMGTFKSFAYGVPALGDGVVILTNGANGLAVCRDIVRRLLPIAQPTYRWLDDFYSRL